MKSMAKLESFDVTTGCDLQEVDNALNQARRELTGRFDFKGVLAELKADLSAGTIEFHTSDGYKLDAIWDAFLGRLVARNTRVSNVKRGEVQAAGEAPSGRWSRSSRQLTATRPGGW
jgi:cyclic-di-GMP-binding protein